MSELMELSKNLSWSNIIYFGLLIAIPVAFVVLYLNKRRRQRQRILANLEQLKLLRLLLADLQRHRGLSTGFLSGDQGLRTDVANVRARVDQNIDRAKALQTNHGDEWKGVIGQWNALRLDGNSDPETNMLDHHSLIRDTIFLIEDISGEIDLGQGRDELGYLICIWHEVVQTAEWSGQARALGTGIAAAGKSSAAQRVRLRFLHQKIGELSATAFKALRLSFSGQERLRQCQSAVEGFLGCIERELLADETPHIDTKRYFDQATSAINELLGLVDTALNDLQQVHQRR